MEEIEEESSSVRPDQPETHGQRTLAAGYLQCLKMYQHKTLSWMMI